MIRNAAATPQAAMIAPPTAGPKLRAMLKPMLLYATTAGSSERGTMSLTDACQAGELSAVPQPIAKVKSSKIEGVSPPSHATSASNSDVASMNSWATINMILRSRLSATAPDHSDRRTSGNQDRRRRQDRHHPRCRDELDESPEIRDETCNPDRAKNRDCHRRGRPFRQRQVVRIDRRRRSAARRAIP